MLADSLRFVPQAIALRPLTAVLFGLAHIPNATHFVPFSGLVLARALILNGVAALVFGWLYWRKGLEAAMLAHFSADIVVHVLFVV